jgi:hypothetical protein
MPRDEIVRAVAANGSADVSQARPDQFLKAFTAVALRVSQRNLPDYVISAIDLRADLSANIVAVAIDASIRNCASKPQVLCAVIQRIVKAAIAANPDGAVSIAKAAASAAPELRRCVVSAAIAAAPADKDAILQATNHPAQPWAFLAFSAADGSAFSYTAATLSPANISNLGDDGVNSPEQPPTP